MNCINKDTGVTIRTSALINNGDKTMDYASSFGTKDLEFYNLMFSGGDNEESDYNFEITKGITIGSTEDDVKNAFGEPDYVTYYDAYMYFENPDAVSDKSEPAENPDMHPLILVMAKFQQSPCLQKWIVKSRSNKPEKFPNHINKKSLYESPLTFIQRLYFTSWKLFYPSQGPAYSDFTPRYSSSVNPCDMISFAVSTPT